MNAGLRVSPTVPRFESGTTRFAISVDDTERHRIATLAASLRSADPGLDTPESASLDLSTGLADGPRLLFEDHREISLCEGLAPTLEQRPILLAGEGDAVATSGADCPEFEEYCRRDLHLGTVTVRRLGGPPELPIPARYSADPAAMAELVEIARRAGHLNLVPYIGTPGTWELARRLATAGVAIRVVAPPPVLTSRVNNKAWFAQHARRVLGLDAVQATSVASDVRELRSRLNDLTRSHDQLVVKAPASAGGRGIVRLDRAQVRADRVGATIAWVTRRLEADGWNGEYPLLVGGWEESALSSPSVQLWIPRAGEGDPVVQGVFEQQLDDGFRFAGATTSALPDCWNETVATQASRLALFLQALGYFGACSFDGLLVGERIESADLRWLECNGRWTSTSIALLAARRLTDASDHPLAVIHRRRSSAPRSFDEVLDRLGADAFHRRDDGIGAVVVAPRRIVDGTGLCLLVIGPTVPYVTALAQDLIGRFE